ncbi:endopeptidase ClpA [Staphylococcus aureus T54294]|uniref:ATP-dependent Clp protease ATP-binding subunit n=1 Tax=Staphylococcus aureus TaxID=1280 RepID=UPI00045258A0|nr:AAA family ATPase [Staphylococcus aureus]EVU48661.1 endopeptidase ClpA [Staphylococcus aureus M85201]EVV50624.1 endopeptidase ClpA [Staphylococcus aureus W48872]EWI69064.1 endopeptidase ClpA [Staphylococcus aureus T54294]EWK18069.1 endopeptidase ClpA [Staphylococcus aureus T92889]EWY17779.1 endopeptidase ClpA [Staphylococcus aureus W76930]
MEIHVYTGPLCGFNEYINSEVKEYHRFMELIREYNIIVRASDTFGTHVITNFINIVTLGRNIKKIYIQNPPKRVFQSLNSFHDSEIIEINYEYTTLKKDDVINFYKEQMAGSKIIGQTDAKKQMSIDLYKHTSLENNKPTVMLYYGPSGVGKTELAKEIAKKYKGNITRIQFSMMQNDESFNYIFGDEHAKVSLSKDLVDRETNVVLIDEFDKVLPIYYNVFYQMFDEGIIEDANYKVDVSNCIFILTSNFNSIEEAIVNIGEPVFSRIDSCIKFLYLTQEEKQKVIENKLNEILSSLNEKEKRIVTAYNLLEKYKETEIDIDNIRYLKKIITNDIYTIIFEDELFNTDIID